MAARKVSTRSSPRQGDVNVGATIMGRNMFGPIRGSWGDESWKGWWGDNPPYHHPTFVLTHHARAPIPMEGGTTFHFVTDGIEAALEQAFDAAGGADVRLGGGWRRSRNTSTRLIDEMHLAIVPMLLGSGERLFDNLDGGPDGYDVEFIPSPAVVHAADSGVSDSAQMLVEEREQPLPRVGRGCLVEVVGPVPHESVLRRGYTTTSSPCRLCTAAISSGGMYSSSPP